MSNIYYSSNEFDPSEVARQVTEISEEMQEELSKPDKERSRERELKLANKQLMVGLKLSTGFVRF